MPGYRFLEHITDAEIEAYGKNLEESFENAAKALEDTMVDLKSINPRIAEKISIKGKDKQSLLYSWLEALIFREEVEGMLYSDFKCRISEKEGGYVLNASVKGEKYDPGKHQEKTAVKAPTYHEMMIDESTEVVKLRFLLDL